MGAATQLDSMIRSLPLAVLTLITDNFPTPPRIRMPGRKPGTA